MVISELQLLSYYGCSTATIPRRRQSTHQPYDVGLVMNNDDYHQSASQKSYFQPAVRSRLIDMNHQIELLVISHV
jgi:hypothetical protein